MHRLISSLFAFSLCQNALAQQIDGELRVWHKVTLTFDGPEADEQSLPNPFSDYRLVVTFSQDTVTYRVPGYFAADGNAAETDATVGNQWRVHFTPDKEGPWHYVAAFHHGADLAISDAAGTPLPPDGTQGIIDVLPSDKSGTDFRRKGLLQYVLQRYLDMQGLANILLKPAPTLLRHYWLIKTSMAPL